MVRLNSNSFVVFALACSVAAATAASTCAADGGQECQTLGTQLMQKKAHKSEIKVSTEEVDDEEKQPATGVEPFPVVAVVEFLAKAPKTCSDGFELNGANTLKIDCVASTVVSSTESCGGSECATHDKWNCCVAPKRCSAGFELHDGNTAKINCGASTVVSSTVYCAGSECVQATDKGMCCVAATPDPAEASYDYAGDGIAGSNSKLIDGALKFHDCFAAVTADPECAQDYFTYMSWRSRCECKKGSKGEALVVLPCNWPCTNAKYYKIKAETNAGQR